MTERAGTFLFIENREKTWFWDAVAAELERRGHKISWIVQNPMFTPKLTPGDIHRIPFPRADQLQPYSFARNPVLEGERGSGYFAAGSDHFSYYEAAIEIIIDAVCPDVGIGETTLFQELMSADLLAKRGIPFLHPSAERYPQACFSLLDGPTQNPFLEPGEQMAEAEAEALAQRIYTRAEVLIYMKPQSALAKQWNRLRWASGRAKVTFARWLGERYNTPSLRHKLALARENERLCSLWRAHESQPEAGERSILYPLQMQPEASIDVWGLPYNDQLDLVRRLAAAVPDDVSISIKANPKTKYEMKQSLIDFAIAHPRIHLLPLSMKMDEAQPLCVGAITVCGTVGLEAVFGRGRCISLRHPILNRYFPDFAAETPEEAIEKLLAMPHAGIGSRDMGARYLQAIRAQAYPGWISDPFSMPECLDADNVALVANGLEAGLAQVRSQRIAT